MNSKALFGVLLTLCLSLPALADYVVLESTHLLKWKTIQSPMSQPAIPYDRLKQFGTWKTDLTHKTCLNTRNMVLVRDSKTSVKYEDESQCNVESGTWKDPYTNTFFKTPVDIQIDHMVPLKNAYDAGAWTWGENRRCLFANYQGNDFHLRPVSGLENMIKGADGPDGYIPPNGKFVCEYLRHWLMIKLIWNLKMKMSEADAILAQVQEYSCDKNLFFISKAELKAQKEKIQSQQGACDLAEGLLLTGVNL